MASALSVDLCKRIIRAIEGSLSRRNGCKVWCFDFVCDTLVREVSAHEIDISQAYGRVTGGFLALKHMHKILLWN